MNLQTLSRMIDVVNPIKYCIRHLFKSIFYTLDVSGVGYVSGVNYRHIDRSFHYLYFNVSNNG
jgi:hypothetical protein